VAVFGSLETWKIRATTFSDADRNNALTAEMIFTHQSRVKLKNLAGWKKNDRLPDRVSDFSQTLIAKAAAEELTKDLDQVHAKLKEVFGFSRRELSSAQPNDGTGTITTPHFSYSVTVSHNPDQLDEALWTRTVESIKSPAEIASTAFAKVFDGVFSTLAFELPAQVSIEDFIDEVETAKIPDLKIHYDRDATFCELQLPGSTGMITLRPTVLSIVHKQRTETQALLKSFEMVRQLVEDYKLSPISFAAN
jgi:hypothetical protein